MHPELFTIGHFTVSTFGPMVALAFLVGSWITAIRMREEGLDPELAWNLMIYVMLGGMLGAKLYFAVDTHLRTGQPFAGLLFSRAGITWYGGLLGATLAGTLAARWYGVSIKQLMDCTAVAGPIGQAIGRVGCFLVGDDYGRASNLPWAVAFPKGSPPTIDPSDPTRIYAVHPTQIYEILWLLPVAALLWKRRHKSPFLFAEYLVLNGLGRIFIEMLRVNPKVALGLTEPQFVGIALIVFGAISWLYFRWKLEPVAG
jgi:phosphatidylglycerol---prolipoprotein diacylglyceryl transferase